MHQKITAFLLVLVGIMLSSIQIKIMVHVIFANQAVLCVLVQA